MEKLAIVIVGAMVFFSATSVSVAWAHERPFVAPMSFTAETSFTAEPADMSLPGFLVFVTLCGSVVGGSEE